GGAVRLPYCVDVRLRFRIAGRLEYRWTWTVPQQSSLRRLQRYRGLLRHAILVLFGSAHPEGTVLYPARRLHLRSPDHQWRLLFLPYLFNAGIVFFDLRWSGHPLDTQPCTSLIDQVNGFIRQEAIRDVAVCHGSCPLQGFIGNRYTVVCFIPVTQP